MAKESRFASRRKFAQGGKFPEKEDFSCPFVAPGMSKKKVSCRRRS